MGVIDGKESEKLDLLAGFQREKTELRQHYNNQILERDIKIKELFGVHLQLESRIRQQEQTIRVNADVQN